jgi:hypothetical protein
VKPFFDEKFELDPGIAFHGTSQCFQSLIESEGLLPDRGVELRSAIERLVRLFKHLDWSGISPGSRGALEHFTLNHDLASPRGKPIYLAESSARAATFASRDFAGGEGARGLRYSFEDLWAYLKDPTVRARHLESVIRGFRARQQPDALQQAEAQLANIDLTFVRAELEALADVERRVRRFHDDHAHGLIYAVRLPAAIQDFEYHGSMGLKCFGPLGPGCIVDNVVLPADFKLSRGMDEVRFHKGGAWSERFRRDGENRG